MTTICIQPEGFYCTDEKSAQEIILAFWRKDPGFEDMKEILIIRIEEGEEIPNHDLLADMFLDIRSGNLH